MVYFKLNHHGRAGDQETAFVDAVAVRRRLHCAPDRADFRLLGHCSAARPLAAGRRVDPRRRVGPLRAVQGTLDLMDRPLDDMTRADAFEELSGEAGLIEGRVDSGAAE